MLTNYDLTMEFHRQNQERMTSLEKEAKETTVLLATIAANTSCLADLKKRVDDIESRQDKQTGAIAILVFLWGGVELLLHWFHKN